MKPAVEVLALQMKPSAESKKGRGREQRPTWLSALSLSLNSFYGYKLWTTALIWQCSESKKGRGNRGASRRLYVWPDDGRSSAPSPLKLSHMLLICSTSTVKTATRPQHATTKWWCWCWGVPDGSKQKRERRREIHLYGQTSLILSLNSLLSLSPPLNSRMTCLADKTNHPVRRAESQ